jgi:hypothetical protein
LTAIGFWTELTKLKYLARQKVDELQFEMRLPVRQRTTIRHFIYYLVNGTLDFVLINNRLKGKYRDLLKSNQQVFYKACCVFINQQTKLNPEWLLDKRIAEFICKSLDPVNNRDLVELEDWETNFSIQTNNLKDEFKSFTTWFVDTPIVDGINFRNYIGDGASFVEQCYAIWTNVIEYDGDKVQNSNHTRQRVAEYIKSYYIRGYVDNLEDWECELH